MVFAVSNDRQDKYLHVDAKACFHLSDNQHEEEALASMIYPRLEHDLIAAIIYGVINPSKTSSKACSILFD